MSETAPERVAVIGGGALGTTAAGDLATRGVDVTLFERETVAAGATGRAAGICYDAYADRRDVRLARRALERFRALDVPFETCPYVLLAREGDRAGAIESLTDQMRSRGVDVALVDPDALGERFPALVTADVTVAAVAENAGVIDPTAYTEAMADRARAAGARIERHTPVELSDPTTVLVDDRPDSFDAVLVAAGPATKPLVADVGVELALGWYRAQVLVTDPIERSPPTVYDASGQYYLRPRAGGVLLGDGVQTGVDPEHWDRSADRAFLDRGRERLRTALDVAPSIDRSWAGLCTATPDRDPLVGRVAPGLYVATGWHGYGLMRAPAVAEAVTEQLLGGEGITGFEPTRFGGRTAFDVTVGTDLDGA